MWTNVTRALLAVRRAVVEMLGVLARLCSQVPILRVSLCLVLSPASGAQVSENTNWWTNRTSLLNVFDPGSPSERLRLGAQTSGFLEGSLAFSQPGLWTLQVVVQADEATTRNVDDFVDVTVNGSRVGRAYNAPGTAMTAFMPIIPCNLASYRFDFWSGNTTTGLHQVVLPGSASATAVPNTGCDPMTLAATPTPAGIVFDSAGNIYMGQGNPENNGAGHTIKRVTVGSQVAEIYSAVSINDPDPIAFDETGIISGVPGSVIVGSCCPSDRLYAVLPDRSVVVLITDARLGNPNNLFVAPDGELLATSFETGNLLKYSMAGGLRVLTGIGTPADICVVPDGSIFAGCSNGCVRRYAANGTPVEVYATGLGEYPLVAVGPGGTWGTHLYVYSRTLDELREYSAPGVFSVITRGLAALGPVDMIFGPDGELYISANNQNRIVRVPYCPRIVVREASLLTCPSPVATLSFSLPVASSSAYSLQWQYRGGLPYEADWVNLVEGANTNHDGIFIMQAFGVNSESLTVDHDPNVSGWPGVISTTYEFRCIVESECGEFASNPASLTICPPDFDCNGIINSQDFFAYLTVFLDGEPFADFNQDGFVNTQDFFDFITALFDGCDN